MGEEKRKKMTSEMVYGRVMPHKPVDCGPKFKTSIQRRSTGLSETQLFLSPKHIVAEHTNTKADWFDAMLGGGYDGNPAYDRGIALA
jgi:hypothetical protein